MPAHGALGPPWVDVISIVLHGANGAPIGPYLYESRWTNLACNSPTCGQSGLHGTLTGQDNRCDERGADWHRGASFWSWGGALGGCGMRRISCIWWKIHTCWYQDYGENKNENPQIQFHIQPFSIILPAK